MFTIDEGLAVYYQTVKQKRLGKNNVSWASLTIKTGIQIRGQVSWYTLSTRQSINRATSWRWRNGTNNNNDDVPRS